MGRHLKKKGLPSKNRNKWKKDQMGWLGSAWFGIRNRWSNFIYKIFNNSRYADQISKYLKVNEIIFGKDIDLDKEIILDSRGNRITNEYCEKIVAEINASSVALPRHTSQ
jgi:hypothetical protein